MKIEENLQRFWVSYRPVLELIREKAGSPSLEELAGKAAGLFLPTGWTTVSSSPLKEIYNIILNKLYIPSFQQEEQKDAEILGYIPEKGDANDQIRWIEELCSLQGMGLGGRGPWCDYFVRFVSLDAGQNRIRFVPGYTGTYGFLMLDPPIPVGWTERGSLTNTFIDRSSTEGVLWMDWEEKDGKYRSASLISQAPPPEGMYHNLPDAVVTVGLTLLKDREICWQKRGIKHIKFKLDTLGSGEVDSFLRYAGL